MNKPLDFNSKEIIYPIFVILLSIINIANHISSLVSLSVLVSLIGIAGGVLFIYRYTFSTKLIYFWTIIQVLVVIPSFDMSQAFSLSWGYFENRGGIYLNYLPLLYLGFMKVIEASILIGKPITFIEFREGGTLGDIFPRKGTIKDRLEIDKEKNYLLVELDAPFYYEGQDITHVLVKGKDKEKSLKLGRKNQLAFFRIVKSQNDLIKPHIDKFPFIDWVYAK